MLEKITPLILTYNEAPNIGRTLEQLCWARDIVVVDSFSDDETLEIVRSFPRVRIYQREFDSHQHQWNFGLKETGISSEWVLGLDADYVLTAEFSTELRALQPATEVKAYRASFIYCINGKRINSGVYPPVTVLYRPVHASYTSDGHTQRLVVDGKVENMSSPILHDDRKPLGRWLYAQSRYTQLEADKLLSADPDSLSWNDRIRRWRVVAPTAMLFYCLIVRGGVLDGWAGFYYAFQRALAELMLSLYLMDQDLRISTFGFPNVKFEKEQPEATQRKPQLEMRNSKSEIRNS
jgi:glycosyltransferase involved in cell wall biosynthesis